jgi:hypothetical protein
MLTYQEFLSRAVERGEGVNMIFEERLFALIAAFGRISDALAEAYIHTRSSVVLPS